MTAFWWKGQGRQKQRKQVIDFLDRYRTTEPLETRHNQMEQDNQRNAKSPTGTECKVITMMHKKDKVS